MIASIQKYLFCLSILFFTACGSTPPPKVEAPVAPPPVVQEPTTTPPEQPVEPEPVMSPELAELHEAMRVGNLEAIQTKARQIIDKDPTGADAVVAYRALAEMALETSPATARLYIERAAERAPNDPDVFFVFGKIAHAQANDDEALKHFETAANADPKNASACLASAAILLTYLDLEQALERADCAMKRQPDRCDVVAMHADTRFASKRFEDAAASYEKYLDLSCPVSEDVLRRLAKLHETHLSNAKRACEVYAILAELRPDNPDYAASRDYQCGQ